jgi:signal transduction histidine kinase
MRCHRWMLSTATIEFEHRRKRLSGFGNPRSSASTRSILALVHCVAAWLRLGLIFLAAPLHAQDVQFPALTNLTQLRQIDAADAFTNRRVQLEGMILWARPAAGKFVLQDAAGAALLEMDLPGAAIHPGQRVRITGNGAVTRDGGGWRLGVCGTLVDNDGIHSMQEKAGGIWLPAGRHPVRLDWFNGSAGAGLEVEYSGPGLPRQKIPNESLSCTISEATPSKPGLNYACFELPDNQLPQAEPAVFLAKGVARNFDVAVRSRPEHVALRFTGFIKVAREGFYTFYLRSDDGSRLFIDAPSLRLESLGESPLPAPRVFAAGQVMDADSVWAQVSGIVDFVSETADGFQLELSSGTSRMAVAVASGPNQGRASLLKRQIRATGVCLCDFTADGQKTAGYMFVPDAQHIELTESGTSRLTETNGLPVLVKAVEVHGLTRQEAQRGYPVCIRGVVTCVEVDRQAITVQDATRGLYVFDLSADRSRLPAIGSFVEVKGSTDPGFFAPVVHATRVTELGAGCLPETVRPTWDQLVNGSLDAQYVELQGIITAVSSNGVTLLTREGRINLELRMPGTEKSEFPRFENSLVRIRGCLFANWDYLTHEVKAGEVRLYGAKISVDQAAPDDLFATRKKSFGELLLFDPLAGAFERVKVSGQVLQAQGAEGFLTDGKSGLRFAAHKPADLSPGDLVEVVGFSELSGASPTLREAVIRKTGRAPLPPALVLPKDEVVDSKYDATRVLVRGTLVSVRRTHAEHLLEIQSGLRTFVARLADGRDLNALLPAGSLLELDGVYSGLGGNKAIGQGITSFELLLNNPSNIKVLAHPPWWTLERLLVIVGALASVLAVTVLWITQLRRKVEARTAELEVQIKERQRVEQQRAMEQERARVAQDLHDELGSSLTEISMLAARARASSVTDEIRKNYLEQMSGKAHEIVGVLDEIVWAMNPRHDSMSSLVSYFCLYADRFLGLAGIAWKLEQTEVPQDFAVDSRCRHQLFLAFKEALTNVVRHSQAREVRLRFGLENGEVRLSVADNGRGLPDSVRTENMDGVANMRIRIEKLGGRFELASEPGRGTTVSFHVPANKNL